MRILFLPNDVHHIKAIFPAVNKCDFWIWPNTNSEAYLVKFGCCLFEMEETREIDVDDSLNHLK